METKEIRSGGGKISHAIALRKKEDYMMFKQGLGIDGQTDYIIFDRVKLQNWLVGLPEDATKVLVFMGLQEGELDVFFWPFDNFNQKVVDDNGMLVEGYNIGDRHPLFGYEL